jgi:hypothetical protein
MKKYLLMLFLCGGTACASLHAQPLRNERFTDASGNTILLGTCARETLYEAPFAQWFQPAYEQYVVDTATCVFIRPLLSGKKLTLFMGTWCGDSRREVPRILKMLDCCGFPPEQLQLVMVGNQPGMYKQSPGHEESGRQIRRVPTLIIESGDNEWGRIIELPVVSLEKDLLRILRKEGYVPNYSQPDQALAGR